MSMLFQSRRPLRYIHSSPSETCLHPAPEVDPESLITPSRRGASTNRSLLFCGVVVMKLTLVVSLVFIFTICLCFFGANVDEEYLEKALTKTANTEPGVVLLGENVDVDVDEPSITIRWSILACGKELFLPGSEGAHGSAMCGLPTLTLRVFVDNNPGPAAIYDPTQIPFSRRRIQNLVQFDSDHVLDVHKAHLYPFDSYILSSTIHALSETNETVPIRTNFSQSRPLLALISTLSTLKTVDTETYLSFMVDTETVIYSRDVDIYVTRPASARIISVTFFALNWIVAHVAAGLAYVCCKLTDEHLIIHLLSACAILIAIPQLSECSRV